MTLAAARYPVIAKYDPPMIAILHVTYSDGSVEDYQVNLGLVSEFPTTCGPGTIRRGNFGGDYYYEENGVSVWFSHTSGGSGN